MAKKWAEVAADPDFQALSIPEKRQVRDQYFHEVVVPQIPAEQKQKFYNEFYNDVGIPDDSLDAAPQEQPAAPKIEDRNLVQRVLADPFMRGVNQLQQAGNVGQALMGINPEGAMRDFIKNEQQKQQYPLDPKVAEGTQEIMAAEGFGGTVRALARNPSAIWNTVVESIASSAPSLVGGAIGTAGGAVAGGAAGSVVPVLGTVAGATAGGVAGGMAGSGAGSYITEFTNTVGDQLQASGVDMNDPVAMSAMLQNPDFREAAISKAKDRASAIAIFDAISMGVAGRIAKPVSALAKSPVGKVAAGGTAEVVTQAGLGSGGEAAAQLNSEGRITSPGAIAMEGVGEIVPGAIEAGINVAADRFKPSPAAPVPVADPAAPAPRPDIPFSQVPPAAPVAPMPAPVKPSIPDAATRAAELDAVLNTDIPIPDIIDATDFPDKLPTETVIAVTEGGDGTDIVGYAYMDEKTGSIRYPGAPVQPTLSKAWQEIPDNAELPAGAQITVDEATGKTKARATTPSTPAPVNTAEELAAASAQAASSPLNDLPEPTDAQKEAGNYKKAHVNVQGLNVSIETPKGGARTGKSPDGSQWSVTMPVDYGYVKGTVGADKEQFDVFIGDNPKSDKVYVIDQHDPDHNYFDEHKAMVGFNDIDTAVRAYQASFSDGKGGDRIGQVSEFTMPEFKKWLAKGQPQADMQGRTKLPSYRRGTPGSFSHYDSDGNTVHRAGTGIYQYGHLTRKDGTAQIFQSAAEVPEAVDITPAAKNSPAPTDASPELPVKTLAMVDEGIANLNEEALSKILSNLVNKQSRAHFQKQTGVKLPNGVKATKNAIAEWAKRESNRRMQSPVDNPEGIDISATVRKGDKLQITRPGAEYQWDVIEKSEDSITVQDESGTRTVINRGDGGWDLIQEEATIIRKPASKAPSYTVRTADIVPTESGYVAVPTEPERTVTLDAAPVVDKTETPEPKEELSVGRRQMIDQAISENNIPKLKAALASPSNPKSREYFTSITGLELPLTRNDSMAALDKWGKEQYKLGKKVAEERKAAEESFSAEYMPESPSPEKSAGKLADHFLERIREGASYPSIAHARREAAQVLGEAIQPNTAMAKMVDEQIEVAFTLAARKVAESSTDPLVVYDKLVKLYDNQPILGQRSSTSLELQAFSTPAPIAFLSSSLAGISKQDTVLEPTAGNGSLLILANTETAIANELDKARAETLQKMYPELSVLNTDFMQFRTGDITYDAVVANPPFGKLPNGGTYQIGASSTPEIDQAIVLKALADMDAGGKAALIIGSKRGLAKNEANIADKYNSANARLFFKHLYDNYKVTHHFTIDGSLYKKQGAEYPIDIIIVNGRGKTTLPLPGVQPPKLYKSFDELRELFNGQPLYDTGVAQTVTADSEKPTRANEPVRVPQRDTAAPAVSDRQAVETGSERDNTGGAELSPVREPAVPVVSESELGGTADAAPASKRPPVVRDTSNRDEGQPRRSAGERAGDTAGTARSSNEPSNNRNERVKKKETVSDSGYQITYTPTSSAQSLGTLVPVKMKEAIDRAISNLEAEVGNIDQFVTDQLQYGSIEEMQSVFAAEQVEAVALAVHNMAKGEGFIIGDQTGIGKGRVNAAVLRFARLSGKTPIFVTKEPGLYGDMYRDLHAIGERNIKAFVTNTDITGAKAIFVDETGDSIKSATAKEYNRISSHILDKGTLPPEYGYLFTTYSQLQPVAGKSTPRHKMFEAIIGRSIISFDESHEAGGASGATGWKKKSETPEHHLSRASFARYLVDNAAGVFYSSATFAKSPDVMDLYRRTQIRRGVEKIDDLGTVIQRGGVPLQQVIANMLVESGQYMRREKSFEGISMQLATLPADIKMADRVSNALRLIFDFDLRMDVIRKNMAKEFRQQAGAAGRDNAISEAGLSSVSFSSIMHNIINQALTAQKIKSVAEQTIAKHKEGKKVLIALSNTQGSFLTDYMETTGLGLGDEATGLNFNRMLQRYLERTRIMTQKDSEGKSTKLRLSDGQLGSGLAAEFDGLVERISEMDFGEIPVSPIDYLRTKLEEAGIKVGELTGRSNYLEYKNGKQIIAARDNSPAGKKKTMNKFNAGELDVIVLNRSGSTGYSMHANKTFKDRKPRHMFILQAEPDINIYQQMLGRINRTGQVELPSYDIVISDIPVERRPAAMLMKKMASLNANTTANKRGATTIDEVVDFMNPYGDALVVELLKDEPELRRAVDMDLPSDETAMEGMAAQLTGRLAIMPVVEQGRVLEIIESRYKQLIDFLDKQGENALEAKEIDIKAEQKGVMEIEPSSGDSIFEGAVKLEQIGALRLGKPYTMAQVDAKVEEALNGETPSAYTAKLKEAFAKDTANEWTRIVKRYELAQQESNDGDAKAGKINLDKAREVYSNAKARKQLIEDFLATYRVGQLVTLKSEEGNLHGIVTAIGRDDSTSPVALSQFNVTVAVADAIKEVTIPLSQMVKRPDSDRESKYELTPSYMNRAELEKIFQAGQSDIRENRYVVTGNLLKGYEKFAQGKITFFTRDNGDIDQGILMPKSFNPEEELKKLTLALRGPEEAKYVLDKIVDGQIVTMDGWATIERDRQMTGLYKLSVSRKARSIITSGAVREALGKDLYSRTGDFTQNFTPDKLKDVYRAVEIVGSRWGVKRDQDQVRAQRGEDAAVVKFRRGEAGTSMGGAKIEPVTNWTKQRKEIAAELTALAKERFGSDLKIAFGEKITDAAGNEVFGTYTTRKFKSGAVEYWAAVSLSENSKNPTGTLNHEGIHFLKATGAIDDATWAVLKQKAYSAWIKDYDIRNLYKNDKGEMTEAQHESLVVEEAIAEAYQEKAKWNAYPQKVRAIFRKIESFLAAIREKLTGRGITKADEIFMDISAGKYATAPRTAADQVEQADGSMYQRKSKPEPIIINISDRGILETITDGNMSMLARLSEATKKDTVRATLDHWRRFMQDRFLHFYRVQQRIEEINGEPLPDNLNVYGIEETFSGRAGYKLDQLERKHKEPLIQLIADFNNKHGDGIETIEKFLYALHAPERNAQIAKINPDMPEGGSGMRDEEAAAIITTAKETGKHAELMDIATRVHAMLNESLSERVKMGLISQKTADAWRHYKHYVPLRGFQEMEAAGGDTGAKIGRGLDVRGQESKRAKGRKSLAGDILGHAFAIADEAIIRGEKNRVGKALYDLVTKNPSPSIWEVTTPKVVPVLNQATGLLEYRATPLPKNMRLNDQTVGVKIDGVQKFVVLHDKRLATPMKNLEIDKASAVLRALMTYNRFLSHVNTTLNPEFLISNAFRDLQTAGINLAQFDMKGLSKDTARDYFKAIKGAWGGLNGKDATEWQQYFDEYNRVGGKVSFWQMDDLNAMRTRLNRELMMRKKGVLPMTYRGAKAVIEFIELSNQAVENGIRLSAYVNARRRGMSEQQAAQLAKNLTVNFNKRGEFSSKMNALYLFYNASVQGAFVILNALRSRRVRKIALGLVAMGFAEHFMNMMLTPPDDDGEDVYDKIPQYVKEANIIIMDPSGKLGKVVDGIFVMGKIEKVQYVTIPMPYGYRVFHEIGRNAAAVSSGKSTKAEGMVNIVSSIVNNFNPIGGNDGILNFLAPTVLDPVVDINENKNFTGRKIYPEPSPYDRSPPPPSERYFPNVSMSAKWLAQELNTLTGGDKITPGAVSVSPEVLDYAFEQMTGAAGAFAGRTVDSVAKGFAGEELTINEAPILRKMFGANNDYFDRSAAYDRMREVESIVAREKDYRKADMIEEANKLRAANKNLAAINAYADVTSELLSDYRKRRMFIENNKTYTKEQKKEALARVEVEERKAVVSFNRRYLAAKKKDEEAAE